jgi:maleylacetoacetate isomerase
MAETFTLYNYFRSSASYRVRIALNYKNIPYKYVSIHLVKNGGEQFSAEYKKLNPLSQVPCLVHNDQPITQSMAIIMYLEELFQEPALLPAKAYDRAIVVQLCEMINSGIQPLQNHSVLTELGNNFGVSEDGKKKWLNCWMSRGLEAVEETLKKTSGQFSYGDAVTAADCFLVPQVFAAGRFGVDVSSFKNILKVYENCNEIEAFQLAEPSRQPDYQA